MAVSNKKKNTQVRKKDNSIAYIGILGLVFILIYLFGQVYNFLNNKSVPVEIVNYGTIQLPKIYKGVIIRDEYLVSSSKTGEISYYYTEGERVKKNSVVCIVKDYSQTEMLENEIQKYDSEILKLQRAREDISIYQNDISVRNNNIKEIVEDYMLYSNNYRISQVYDFKEKLESEINLRTQILLMENSGSVSAVMEKKDVYEKQLKANTDVISTPVSGIVSFLIDGFEEVYSIENMLNLRNEQTTMEINTKEKRNSVNGEEKTIFKVVKSDEWYIAAYIPENIVKSWYVGDIKKITVNDKSINMKVNQIVEGVSEKLVIFSSDRGMLDFLSERSINFEVGTQSYEGLKIPNTALVETTFLKIPTAYVTESMGQDCVIKAQEVGNILVDIEISFTDDTEEFVYVRQDFDVLKLGDKLIEPNSENPSEYRISEVTTSKGVYVVNNGVTELKTVEVLGENETYSIVNASKKRSLKAYDRIVSDAKNITENQIIY